MSDQYVMSSSSFIVMETSQGLFVWTPWSSREGSTFKPLSEDLNYDPVTEPNCVVCKACGAEWEKQPEHYGDCMTHKPECRILQLRNRFRCVQVVRKKNDERGKPCLL